MKKFLVGLDLGFEVKKRGFGIVRVSLRSDSLGGFLEDNVTASKRVRLVKRGICGLVRVGLMNEGVFQEECEG